MFHIYKIYKKNNKGFTLFEIIGVIFVISILSTLIGLSVFTYTNNAKYKKLDADAKSLYTAIVAKNACEPITTNNGNVYVNITPNALQDFLQKGELEDITKNINENDDSNNSHLQTLIKDGEVVAARIIDKEGNIGVYPIENSFYFENYDVNGGIYALDDKRANMGEKNTLNDLNFNSNVAGFYPNSGDFIDWKTLVDNKYILLDETGTILINSKTPNKAAFNYSKVGKLVLPNTILEIGDNAFLDCKCLSQIVISPLVTKIGENAFANSGLSGDIKIVAPKLETISKNAFANCGNITSVTLCEGVEVLEEGAFSQIGGNDCNANVQIAINLPASLKKIKKNCFANSKNITLINFANGSNLEYIEENAFDNIGHINTPYSGLTIYMTSNKEISIANLGNMSKDFNNDVTNLCIICNDSNMNSIRNALNINNEQYASACVQLAN